MCASNATDAGATDQVGIPEVFAKKLSWAEPVNRWNIRRLRQAVVNGPNVWPGANYIVDERGVHIDLSKKSVQFRLAQAKQLEKADGRGMSYKVGRHLIDGDYVLVNRQPSLHKCSMMAHRVRVNQNQRVIRIHYANCKSYNADFDGDEINVHFPQAAVPHVPRPCLSQSRLGWHPACPVLTHLVAPVAPCRKCCLSLTLPTILRF